MKAVSAVVIAVAICTLVAADASAEANLALRGIGVRAGVVNPEDVDATFGFSLVMDLGTIHPNWALETNAGFWSQSESFYGYEYGLNDFSFGSRVKYLFPVSNAILQPYAGAGLGLHIFNAHAETNAVYYGGTLLYPGQRVENTDLELGLDLGGGLFIDQGGSWAFTTDAWFTVCDVSQFSLMAGAVYMFGR